MLICLNVGWRILTLFLRKNVLFLAIVIFFGGLNQIKVNAQTKKFVLFEHFTNTDCAPCAVQNPVFQSNIINKNKGNVHHISYHPNFPSNVDPMFLANESQNTAMESYYNIVAVPTIIANGQRLGSPGSVAEDDVLEYFEEESAIKIEVDIKPYENQFIEATVNVTVLAEVPSGAWKLKTVLVEKELIFETSPGNNGETDFFNVFRKMMPNTFGETLVLSDVGSTITHIYDFEIEADWNVNDMKVIAYVQDFNTKEILNSGSNEDPKWFMQTDDATFLSTEANAQHTFSSYLVHSSENAENYNVIVQTDMPDDWQLDFSLNGVAVADDGFDFETVAGENLIENIEFTLTTSDVASIGVIRVLALQMGSGLSYSPVTYRVVNNCTDLVIYNDNATSAGLGEEFNDWHPMFVADLKLSGNEKVSFISNKNFVKGSVQNAFEAIESVYYNSAWAFPAFTNDFRGALALFINEGGNVLISGQDFNWDVFSPVGGSNSFDNQQFIVNNFGVEFIGDGTIDNYQIHALGAGEDVFGWMGDSNFQATYTIGSANYQSPDVIAPFEGSEASVIFNYKDDVTLPAALKNELPSGGKTVMLGFGMEQIENELFRQQLMQTVYWWFNDSLFVGQTIVNQQNPEKNSVHLYPNPVFDVLILEGIQFDECLVFNTNGKLIKQLTNSQGLKKLKIETTNWINGVYLIEFRRGGMILATKKILVYR